MVFIYSLLTLILTYIFGDTIGKIGLLILAILALIRIYNKKQERKDNADVEVMSEHLWRVEIELKRDMVDYWNDCFNDLHILKPDWTSPEKLNEQAMVYMLIHEEGKWGELNKRTKYKYKKIIKEISPIDLTEIMKLTLRENEKQLQKQIDFWHREFRFWE